MTTYPAPMCLGCKHLRRDEARACDAFPDGIPLTIWHSAVDHRQAVDGDHGVRYEPESERDEAYVEHVFPAAHEHRFVAERCLVCGCSEPRNPHDEHLPILQPDAPLSVAPHTDEKQQQLALTTCPSCGKSAQDVTDTGYWYTGMVCPQCGHEFATSDERAAVLDVLRSLKADVARAIEAETTRGYANQETIYGAGHRIIGNIGIGGHFEPAPGVTHEHVREALALHEVGSKAHTALTEYVKSHEFWQHFTDAMARYVQARQARDEASKQLDGIGFSNPAYASLNARYKELAEQFEQILAATHPIQRDAENQLKADAARIGLKISSASGPGLPFALYQFWGYMPSIHDIAQLVGANRGDTLALIVGDYRDGHHPHSLSIQVHGHYDVAYTILRLPNGLEVKSPVVRNDTGERTAASGRDVLRALRHMQQMGITKLTATAQKGSLHEPDWNGYYTWARLGFTGRIPESVLDDAQAVFGDHVTRVEQLMALPGGAKWWKDNGDTWYATFDFTEGSLSRQVFDRLAKSLENAP